MSQEQVNRMIMEDLREIKGTLTTHDDRIMQLLVTVGKITVKTGLIVGVFSTVGGALTAVIMKFMFKL